MREMCIFSSFYATPPPSVQLTASGRCALQVSTLRGVATSVVCVGVWLDMNC